MVCGCLERLMCFECNDLLAYTRVGRCCSGSISCMESGRCLESSGLLHVCCDC